MADGVGIVCTKKGFGCTIVRDAAVEEHEIEVPGNLESRGEQLSWLADEAERLITTSGCTLVALQKASGGGKFGASPERSEVEAAVQIGLYRAGVEAKRLTKEGVRSALGIPKAPKAYESLLTRDDVRLRSNDAKRHQYLLALAAAA